MLVLLFFLFLLLSLRRGHQCESVSGVYFINSTSITQNTTFSWEDASGSPFLAVVRLPSYTSALSMRNVTFTGTEGESAPEMWITIDLTSARNIRSVFDKTPTVLIEKCVFVNKVVLRIVGWSAENLIPSSVISVQLFIDDCVFRNSSLALDPFVLPSTSKMGAEVKNSTVVLSQLRFIISLVINVGQPSLDAYRLPMTGLFLRSLQLSRGSSFLCVNSSFNVVDRRPSTNSSVTAMYVAGTAGSPLIVQDRSSVIILNTTFYSSAEISTQSVLFFASSLTVNQSSVFLWRSCTFKAISGTHSAFNYFQYVFSISVSQASRYIWSSCTLVVESNSTTEVNHAYNYYQTYYSPVVVQHYSQYHWLNCSMHSTARYSHSMNHVQYSYSETSVVNHSLYLWSGCKLFTQTLLWNYSYNMHTDSSALLVTDHSRYAFYNTRITSDAGCSYAMNYVYGSPLGTTQITVQSQFVWYNCSLGATTQIDYVAWNFHLSGVGNFTITNESNYLWVDCNLYSCATSYYAYNFVFSAAPFVIDSVSSHQVHNCRIFAVSRTHSFNAVYAASPMLVNNGSSFIWNNSTLEVVVSGSTAYNLYFESAPTMNITSNSMMVVSNCNITSRASNPACNYVLANTKLAVLTGSLVLWRNTFLTAIAQLQDSFSFFIISATMNVSQASQHVMSNCTIRSAVMQTYNAFGLYFVYCLTAVSESSYFGYINVTVITTNYATSSPYYGAWSLFFSSSTLRITLSSRYSWNNCTFLAAAVSTPYGYNFYFHLTPVTVTQSSQFVVYDSYMEATSSSQTNNIEHYLTNITISSGSMYLFYRCTLKVLGPATRENFRFEVTSPVFLSSYSAFLLIYVSLLGTSTNSFSDGTSGFTKDPNSIISVVPCTTRSGTMGWSEASNGTTCAYWAASLDALLQFIPMSVVVSSPNSSTLSLVLLESLREVESWVSRSVNITSWVAGVKAVSLSLTPSHSVDPGSRSMSETMSETGANSLTDTVTSSSTVDVTRSSSSTGSRSISASNSPRSTSPSVTGVVTVSSTKTFSESGPLTLTASSSGSSTASFTLSTQRTNSPSWSSTFSVSYHSPTQELTRTASNSPTVSYPRTRTASNSPNVSLTQSESLVSTLSLHPNCSFVCLNCSTTSSIRDVVIFGEEAPSTTTTRVDEVSKRTSTTTDSISLNDITNYDNATLNMSAGEKRSKGVFLVQIRGAQAVTSSPDRFVECFLTRQIFLPPRFSGNGPSAMDLFHYTGFSTDNASSLRNISLIFLNESFGLMMFSPADVLVSFLLPGEEFTVLLQIRPACIPSRKDFNVYFNLTIQNPVLPFKPNVALSELNTIASVGTLNPAIATQAARTSLILNILSCEADPNTVDFAQNPTLVKFGGSEIAVYVGGSVMNHVLVCSIAALQISIALVYSHFYHVSRDEGFAFSRFPSFLAFPAMMLLQPTAMCAMVTILNAADAVKAVGVISLLIFLASAALVAWHLRPSNFAAQMERESHLHDPEFLAMRERIFSKFSLFLFGDQTWVDSKVSSEVKFVKRNRMLFEEYREGRHRFLAVEIIMSLSCGILEGLKLGAGRCNSVVIAAVVVFGVYWTFTLLWQPFITWFSLSFWFVMTSLQLAESIVALVTATRGADANGDFDTSVLDGIETTANYLLLVRTIFDIVYKAFRLIKRYYEYRMKQRSALGTNLDLGERLLEAAEEHGVVLLSRTAPADEPEEMLMVVAEPTVPIEVNDAEDDEVAALESLLENSFAEKDEGELVSESIDRVFALADINGAPLDGEQRRLLLALRANPVVPNDTAELKLMEKSLSPFRRFASVIAILLQQIRLKLSLLEEASVSAAAASAAPRARRSVDLSSADNSLCDLGSFSSVPHPPPKQNPIQFAASPPRCTPSLVKSSAQQRSAAEDLQEAERGERGREPDSPHEETFEL